jgi:hypothetical protein
MSRVIFTTTPWPKVVELYRSVTNSSVDHAFAPMLLLLEKIASSRYVHGLHGNKSMWDIRIVQTREYDPHGEILIIRYNPEDREFEFELQETASTLYKNWTRKCAPEDAFRTFERLLHLKKWFIEEKKAADR